MIEASLALAVKIAHPIVQEAAIRPRTLISSLPASAPALMSSTEYEEQKVKEHNCIYRVVEACALGLDAGLVRKPLQEQGPKARFLHTDLPSAF